MVDEIKSVYEIQDEVIKKKGKCSCGYRYQLGDIQWYEHSGGIMVKESPVPLWIYFNCRKCGYDTALWKILKRFQLEEAEEEADKL